MPGFSRPLLAALVVGSLLAGCSGGGDEDAGSPQKATPETTTTKAPARVAVMGTKVEAMAPQAPAFPAEVQSAVQATLDAYLAKGVVRPLETGEPATGLEPVFTEAALARLAGPGPDRSAVLEEGEPLRGTVRPDRANATLTALTAPGGEVVLVTAQLDLAHTVEADDRAVAVVRSGEVVLIPYGGWRIDAYDMRTARDTQPPGPR
ncbi:MAG: hypothetical protein ACRD0N_03110 [Acidimicrobiales bacterium]